MIRANEVELDDDGMEQIVDPETERLLVEESEKLWDEADSAMDSVLSGETPLKTQLVDACGTFLGDQHKDRLRPGHERMTINVTQNAVLSLVAVETSQRPRTTVNPTVVDDDPVFALKPKAGQKLAGLLGTETLPGVTPEMLAGLTVFDEDIYEVLLMYTQPTADAMGQPVAPLLKEKDIIRIDNQFLADMVRQRFEQEWEMAGGNRVYQRNVMFRSIFGYAPMLFEWDTEKEMGRVCNPHILSIRIDPMASGVEDAAYVLMDYLMPIEQARLEFPEATTIVERAKNSSPFATREDVTPYGDIDFKRDMVTIRVMWRRHMLLPIPEAEAVDMGLVQTAPNFDPLGEQIEAGYVDKRGEPVYFGGEGWPARRGIMQTKIIMDNSKVVEHGPCQYRDIPLGWAINIPIPYTPFGQGEPVRLDSIQNRINKVGGTIATMIQWWQFPQEVMPMSLKIVFGDKPLYASPRRTIWMDDEKYVEWIKGRGREGFLIDPPTDKLGEALSYLQALLEIHDKLSGNVDVLQGQGNAGDSGEKVKALQTAATGVSSLKGAAGEWMLEYVTRLWIDAMIRHGSDESWTRYTRQLPPAVADELQNRIGSFEYSVSVELSTSRGATRVQQQEQARLDFGAGLRSRESTMELIDVPDPEEDMRKMIEDPVLNAQAMAAQAQGETGGFGEGG